MVNTQLLEEIITRSGKKKAYLAGRCGMTRQSLGNKINNRTEFTGNEMILLCKELDIKTIPQQDAIFFAPDVEENGNNLKSE